MKTFDEAFTIIGSQPIEVLQANMADGIDLMSNETFCRIIEAQPSKW